MEKINLSKHIYEGWTVGDFINSLSSEIDLIMTNQSWKKPFVNKHELKVYCTDNQPFYKKYVPDVVNYFAKKYKIN